MHQIAGRLEILPQAPREFKSRLCKCFEMAISRHHPAGVYICQFTVIAPTPLAGIV
jgi:hypothetical protein